MKKHAIDIESEKVLRYCEGKSTPDEQIEVEIEGKEQKQRKEQQQGVEEDKIDEIINPKDTRKKIIEALEMTQNKRKSNPPKKHGNIPL